MSSKCAYLPAMPSTRLTVHKLELGRTIPLRGRSLQGLRGCVLEPVRMGMRDYLRPFMRTFLLVCDVCKLGTCLRGLPL